MRVGASGKVSVRKSGVSCDWRFPFGKVALFRLLVTWVGILRGVGEQYDSKQPSKIPVQVSARAFVPARAGLGLFISQILRATKLPFSGKSSWPRVLRMKMMSTQCEWYLPPTGLCVYRSNSFPSSSENAPSCRLAAGHPACQQTAQGQLPLLPTMSVDVGTIESRWRG